MFSITGPNMVDAEFRIAPGTSYNISYKTSKTGSYYVGMNPNGPLAKNVTDSASL